MLDHVVIAGLTFRYTAEGPSRLLSAEGNLILSPGGVYSQGTFAPNDHPLTYHQAIFAFIGLTDVEVIRAAGIAYSPDQEAAAMASGSTSSPRAFESADFNHRRMLTGGYLL